MSELNLKLKQSFAKHGIDIPLLFFEEIGSTNDEAKRYAAQRGGEAVFIAERQLGGKGRLGRSFYSPTDTGLYTSLIIESPTELDNFFETKIFFKA